MTPTPPVELPGVSPWWRAATYTLLVILAIGTASFLSVFEQLKAQVWHVQGQLKTQSKTQHIAVLQDAQNAPAMLVTQDSQDPSLQLQRLNAVKEGREDRMHVWALRPGVPPQALGAITSKAATMRLEPAAESMGGVVSLAISVEDKGAVEVKTPRLPFLFQGAWIQKAI